MKSPYTCYYLYVTEYRYYMYQKCPRILHCKYSVHIYYMVNHFDDITLVLTV